MIWAEYEELMDFDPVYDNHHDPDPFPYDEQDPADDSDFNTPDKPNPYCNDKQTKIKTDDDDDKDRPVAHNPFPVP